MKIVVVMSVFDRQYQFDRTLNSIARSAAKDVELVVWDDCSTDRLQFPARFRYNIHPYRTEPEDKFWTTVPAVPFNRGIQRALDLGADVIVLQSPECYHVGDVLADVERYAREGDYRTYACFSANKEQTEWSSFEREDWRAISNNFPCEASSNADPGWFNHSVHRPCHLEFCAAVHRLDMILLNGYDERFADGVACGDCDLLRRVKNLGLDLRIVDDPFVVHQWHYSGPDCYADTKRFKRNQDLFRRLEAADREGRGGDFRAVHFFTEDFK